MRRTLIAILLFLGTLSLASFTFAQAPAPATTRPAVRFEAVDIYLDSGDRPLAAWQVELTATSGDVKIVGIEGGQHRSTYRDPPYYDPAALSGGRIILASYTTSDSPPKGNIHVARVHLQAQGDYSLSAKVTAAADPSSEPIQSKATVVTATAPKEKE